MTPGRRSFEVADPISRFWMRTNRDGSRDLSVVERTLPSALVAAAIAEIRSWPGYHPTPMIRLLDVAQETGVGQVLCKDESARFDAGSFKALGAPLALHRRLAGVSDASSVTACCASDGNHGRALAWAARSAGCRAVVYLPAGASTLRARRIEELGAQTVRVEGRYDDAVERAWRDADARGWLLIADTTDDVGDPTAHEVMAGYTVLVREVLDALPSDGIPSHVFIQAGVGGLACAIIAGFVHEFGASSPRFVLAEPAAAACVLESLARGRPVVLPGSLDTLMDCLSAARPSAAAWPVLESWADGAVAVEDGWTSSVVERLRRRGSDVGPSGAAGLAAFLATAARPELSRQLGLGPDSNVLVVATEEGLER